MNEGAAAGILLAQLVMMIIAIAGVWKVFTKAGEPGWAAIVPFFNFYVMLKIAGKPGWWLLLIFVPLVNIVIIIMTLHGISKSFGKGVGFTLGLLFLGMIFYPILGFGSAQYQGANGGDMDGAQPETI